MEKPTIFVNPKSGSIKINGEVDVVDVDGKVVETLTNPKLCGCGLSKDKPWCDSSHGEYVKIVAQQLRNARELVKPCNLYGATPVRAREIRENELKYPWNMKRYWWASNSGERWIQRRKKIQHISTSLGI